MSTLARLSVLLALIGALAVASSAQAGSVVVVRIPVGDTWFCDQSLQGGVCETEISVGDSVVWDFSGAGLPHTTTDCGDSCDDLTDTPRWDSGTITEGDDYEFTFGEPGTYLYRCNIHPSQMRGRIVVQERPDPEPGEPTNGAPPSKEPIDLPDGAPETEPVATDDDVLLEGLPSVGLVGQQSSSWDEWAPMLFVLGATFVAAAALAYRRAR